MINMNKKPRILVLGSSGLVGIPLCKILESEYELTTTYYQNKFSRTKYEKFLLLNNLTAPGFESRLKKSELQKNLFTYISGGIKSPFFMTNNMFKEQTKKIDINSISKFAPKITEGTKKLKDWVESN